MCVCVCVCVCVWRKSVVFLRIMLTHGMNQCFVPPIADKAPHREKKKERRSKKEEKIA